MAVLDFLFEGKPPQAVTTYGQTATNVPKWLSDYTQGLISRANAVAGEPYQAYEGPRIAGFSPEQEQAFNLTKANVGAYEPYLMSATGMTEQAGRTSPLASAQPYLEQAGKTFPGSAQEYMDPYIQNVLNRQEALSKRTLEEEFLPSLQDAFTKSGQFGSERMMEMGQRGVRDISENLEAQRLASLSGAYGQAGELFGQDVNRMAQLAPVAGNLATAGAELGLRGGQQLGALGEFASGQGLRDAAALEAVGGQKRGLGQESMNLAHQDFLRQQGYPREMVDWMSTVVRGLPSNMLPSSATTSATGPASIYQPSPLSQLASGASALYGMSQMGKQARGGLMQAYQQGGKVRGIGNVFRLVGERLREVGSTNWPGDPGMNKMYQNDARTYDEIADLVDDNQGRMASLKYDRQDTAAREAIYDVLEGRELEEAKRVLGDIGSEWEGRD